MKRKYICLILVFLSLSSVAASAQTFWKQKYTTADETAARTKKTRNIPKLSKELTSSLPDTIDKYRAIFSWIAFNISYDVKDMNRQDLNTSPENVIATGQSVCEGYANLFEALCQSSGLPCQFIAGWTKNMPPKIGKPFTKYTTHAWNAIRLNHSWYLIDVTWGSGSLDETTQKFKKEFNDFYFCIPPDLFFLNHYPEDPKWLLGYKISRETFINLPHYYPIVLANNIHNLKPSEGILNFKRGQKVKFSFSIDLVVTNILVLPSNSRVPYQANFKQDKNRISFEYPFDKQAPYLYIYLNNQSALVYKLK